MGTALDLHLDTLTPLHSLERAPALTEKHEASSLPPASERLATSKLDAMNLEDKITLSPEQSNTLRTMESAILKGDLRTLETSLQKFKNDPDAAKPIMDVLGKDLKSAGLNATYDVDYPANDSGKPVKTGIFSISDLTDPRNYEKVQSNNLCLYTNPGSKAWAETDVPRPEDSNIRTPEAIKIPTELAIKELGAHAAGVLRQTRD